MAEVRAASQICTHPPDEEVVVVVVVTASLCCWLAEAAAAAAVAVALACTAEARSDLSRITSPSSSYLHMQARWCNGF